MMNKARDYFTDPFALFRDIGIAAIMGFIGLYLFFNFWPLSYWYEYRRIAPAGDVYEGEDIYFRSSVDASTIVSVTWTDVLVCKRPDSTEFYQEERVVSTGSITPQMPGEGSVWKFGTSKAPAGSICYVRSSIDATLPMNVHRTSSFIGETFVILPKK